MTWSVLEIGNLNGQSMAEPISISLPDLIEATFQERKNRFVGMIEVAGKSYPAHVPSSGRMRELLFPSNKVYVSVMPPGMRTSYRIHLARYGETLVSVDSLLPNRLMYKTFVESCLKEFAGYQGIKKEVGYGTSRIDLCLTGDAGRCLIEVKSVTLVKDGTAIFPDAPSERGARHLLELARAVNEGIRSAVIFVVQRDDAQEFSPNHATDPNFVNSLRQAVAAGVEVYALDCKVTSSAVSLRNYLTVTI